VTTFLRNTNSDTETYISQEEFDPDGKFFAAGGVSLGPIGYGQTELKNNRKNGSKPVEVEDYPINGAYPADVVNAVISRDFKKLYGLGASVGVGYGIFERKKYIIPEDETQRKNLQKKLERRKR